MGSTHALRAPDLANSIVNRMIRLAPGVYSLLRGLVMREAGTDPAVMFLRDPSGLFNLLIRFYRDGTTAMFIFRNLFVKPLAEYLGLYDRVDDLARAAREGCDELLRVIISIKPSARVEEIGLCVEVGSELVPAGGGGGGRHAHYFLSSRLTASLMEEFW